VFFYNIGKGEPVKTMMKGKNYHRMEAEECIWIVTDVLV
jgi:hypothetical protein